MDWRFLAQSIIAMLVITAAPDPVRVFLFHTIIDRRIRNTSPLFAKRADRGRHVESGAGKREARWRANIITIVDGEQVAVPCSAPDRQYSILVEGEPLDRDVSSA